MFEGEIGRMENFGEIQIFSPRTHKKVLSKMERKINEKIRHYFWTKMPICSCTWACPRCSFSFFSFFFFFPLDVAFFLKFLFFFIFFNLLGKLSHTSIFFPFFFLIYWAGFLHIQFSYSSSSLFIYCYCFFFFFRCDFFLDMIFIF